MGTELLAPLDLAFWHLESDAHPMHLGALAVFSPPPPPRPASMRRQSSSYSAAARPRSPAADAGTGRPAAGRRRRLVRRQGLRRVPARQAGAAAPGEVDPAGGGFMAGATRLAGELMEQPLGGGLPPWQMYVISGAGRRPLRRAREAASRARRRDARRRHRCRDLRRDRLRRGPRPRRREHPPARPVPPRSWMPGPRQVGRLRAGPDRGSRPGVRCRRFRRTGQPPRSARRPRTHRDLQRHPATGHRRPGRRGRAADPPDRRRHHQ